MRPHTQTDSALGSHPSPPSSKPVNADGPYRQAPGPDGCAASNARAAEFRLALAGGGTGGHIYPALAVAKEALGHAQRPTKVLFLVTPEGLEKRVVETHGLPLAPIPAVRLTLANALRVVPGMWAGIREARAVLRRFRPHVLYGTGGFVSFPAVVAAWLERIPVLLHEPNTVPGRANLLLAWLVQGVVTHFSSSGARFGRGVNVMELGTPLRYAFDPSKRRVSLTHTLLVLGGSQGARSLNTLVKTLYPRLAAMEGLSVVHVTGTRDHAAVVDGLGAGYPNIEIVPYTERMDELFYRTDLAVCRAGALTVSELVEFRIPAIYVPFAQAVGNHQFENARLLSDAGASEIVEERDLDCERLLAEISRMAQPDALERYREKLEPFSRPGATARVLAALESLVGTGPATDEHLERR